jgi:glycosyltransferase involved in cell wall biosynthesis
MSFSTSLPRPTAHDADRADPQGRRRLLLDDSLSLINRTGAHFIAKDLVEHFGGHALVRRWRSFGATLPPPLPRKVLGRMMLKEMEWLGGRDLAAWPEPPNVLRLFLDPLYVLRARLEATDLVLCHDIGPISLASIYHPGAVALYREAYAKLVAARPGVVFVSHASQQAFVAEFGNDFRLLTSIPLYVRQGSVEGPSEPIEGLQSPFFLSVGALERRKNHLCTIEAFERSGLAARGVSLVICGSRGDAADEVERLVARTAGSRLLGYVSDAQLRWLYCQAEAFVLPSLLEGFGMPALEAARYGLIPIISRDGALNEAVGGLGLPIDARSPDDIAHAMRRVLGLAASERDDWKRRLREHAATATRARFLQAWGQLIGNELGVPA